jgi:hypothetical protein
MLLCHEKYKKFFVRSNNLWRVLYRSANCTPRIRRTLLNATPRTPTPFKDAMADKKNRGNVYHYQVVFWFLAHLSFTLAEFLIVPRPSLFVTFSHFLILLQRHEENFNQTWHKSSLGGGDPNFVEMKRIPLYQGEIIAKEWKKYWKSYRGGNNSSPEPATQFQSNFVQIIVG